MLRETKLGLLVSCAFLGLLGAVVTSKLHEKDAPSTKSRPAEPESQTATTASPATRSETAPTVSLTSAPPKRHSVAPDLLPPEVTQAGLQEPGPGKTKADAPTPPASVEPVTAPIAPPGLPMSEPPPPEKKGSEETEAAPVVSEAVIVPEKKKKTEKGKPAPKPEGPVPAVEKVETPLPEGIPVTSPPGPPTATPVEPVKEPVVPAPAPEMSDKDKKEKKKKKEKKTDGGAPSSLPEVVATPAPTPSPAPIPEGPPSGLPTVTPVTPPAVEPEKKQEPIVAPKPETVGVKMPETTAPPMAGMGETGKLPVVSPIHESPAPAKDPIPALVPTPLPGTEKKVVPEPVPSPMPPVVARTPEPGPAPGGPVKVESVNEEDYTVKQGDSFASISKEKYKAEGYAEALRRYNQDDTLRSVPLEEKDGILKAGQSISIPDLGFLEKRYSNLLPKMSALPRKDEPPLLAAEGKLTPVPTPPDSAIRTVAASSGVSYRVPPGGLTMREIARVTLGDGERWNQILSLNPNYRPDYVIPAGSVLILPPDARVPAESPH